MRRSGYSLARQQEEVLRLLAMVKSLKHGSEFNEDGRNVIYSPAEVHSVILRHLGADQCSREDSVRVHKLCGLLWAYTETIFFRAHDVTKEIHGPYMPPSEEGTLVVKEYLNLNPREMWPDSYLLEEGEIRVFLYYDAQHKVEIDALNHLYTCSKTSAAEKLKRFYVEVDGRHASVDEICGLTERLGEMVTKNTKFIDALPWHQKVEKYADIFWFRKAPLRQARGADWHVPATVYEDVRSGSPNPLRTRRLSKEEVRRLARLTI